jgi:hypothetical protein
MTHCLARAMARLGLNLNWLDPLEAFRRREPILRRHMPRR